MDETLRRRQIQDAHNKKHGITPQPVIKKPSNAILAFLDVSRRLSNSELETAYSLADEIPLENIPELIQQLEAKMKDAAKKMEFEDAAKYRDQIKQLRDKLTGNRKSG
jgi:excinuclease ABC subunit B